MDHYVHGKFAAQNVLSQKACLFGNIYLPFENSCRALVFRPDEDNALLRQRSITVYDHPFDDHMRIRMD